MSDSLERPPRRSARFPERRARPGWSIEARSPAPAEPPTASSIPADGPLETALERLRHEIPQALAAFLEAWLVEHGDVEGWTVHTVRVAVEQVDLRRAAGPPPSQGASHLPEAPLDRAAVTERLRALRGDGASTSELLIALLEEAAGAGGWIGARAAAEALASVGAPLSNPSQALARLVGRGQALQVGRGRFVAASSAGRALLESFGPREGEERP